MILQYILLGLYYILWAYQGIIVVSIFISWIPSLLNMKIFRMIRTAADWYLEPFRGLIVLGPIDFSPIISIAIYQNVLWLCFNLS